MFFSSLEDLAFGAKNFQRCPPIVGEAVSSPPPFICLRWRPSGIVAQPRGRSFLACDDFAYRMGEVRVCDQVLGIPLAAGRLLFARGHFISLGSNGVPRPPFSLLPFKHSPERLIGWLAFSRTSASSSERPSRVDALAKRIPMRLHAAASFRHSGDPSSSKPPDRLCLLPFHTFRSCMTQLLSPGDGLSRGFPSEHSRGDALSSYPASRLSNPTC